MTIIPKASQTFAPSSELHYWLALWRTHGIGSLYFFELLRLFPQLSTLFHTSTTSLSSLGLPKPTLLSLQNPDWAGVQADLHWAEKPNNHIITWEDARYPHLLQHIADPPPILFIRGNPDILKTPQIAIVGSRNPTPTGLEITRRFATNLSQAGLTISSGLALGIDAAAHQAAVDHKQPTLAVLGCGLDQIYPQRHYALASYILEQGALVSEFPIGTGVKAGHFPRRNRLVSGLSLGVLVVEATLRSGSLITARLATEQGREVFAIPGSICNPLARGCHALIKQGGKLVETTEDILEELVPANARSPSIQPNLTNSPRKNSLDADCQQLLECTGHETTSIDQLAARSGMDTATVISKILLLELKGFITAVPGGYTKCPL